MKRKKDSIKKCLHFVAYLLPIQRHVLLQNEPHHNLVHEFQQILLHHMNEIRLSMFAMYNWWEAANYVNKNEFFLNEK